MILLLASNIAFAQEKNVKLRREYIEKGMTAYTEGYIFVCPFGTEIHGIKSFAWGDITKCEEKILNEIKEIKSKYSIDTTQIILFGYSQGGSRIFSVGLRHPNIFKGIITVAGTFKEEDAKEHLPELKGKDFKAYIMIGGKDKNLENNKKAKEELEKYGTKVHLEIYPEIGHAFPGEPEKELEKALNFLLVK